MNEKEVEQQVRAALDDSVKDLSPSVRQKLYEARQVALSSTEIQSGRSSWFAVSISKPVFGFAVAAGFSAVLLVTNQIQHNDDSVDVSTEVAHENLKQESIDDFLLLSSLDDTDLAISEDLEFAYWLSEQLENEIEPETLSTGDVRNG